MQQNKSGNEISSSISINLNQNSPSPISNAAMTTSSAITTSDTAVASGSGNTTTATIVTTNNESTGPAVASTTSAAATNASSKSPGGAFDTKWIFPAEKIINSPSRPDGISYEDELMQRQESALFITDLGHMLKRNQLAINTAIIYMHRFYMIHSFKKFQRYVRMVASACLFFACKVEETPLRLREFTDAIHLLLHKANQPKPSDQEMRKYGDEIVALESCLIQTLGFNVCINHAHTIIIKTCQMIKAPRDLAEAAYLTATNSLMLTDFCVKFSPEKVACFCIYLACKWTGMIIPTSSEGFQWYQYVQPNMTEIELEEASKEYLEIYDKCPPRVHRKLGRYKEKNEPGTGEASESIINSISPASKSMPQQQSIKQEPQVPVSTSSGSGGSGSASSSQTSHTQPSGQSRPHHQPYPHPHSHTHHPPHHQGQHHYQHRGHQPGRPHHSGTAQTSHRHPQQQQQQQQQPHHSSQHHQQPNREFTQDS